jgi:hypothetical protein
VSNVLIYHCKVWLALPRKRQEGCAGWETKLAGLVRRSFLTPRRFKRVVFILPTLRFTSKRQWTVEPFFVIVTVDRCTISPFPFQPKDDFVMCWVSECGRCYNESLGMFPLAHNKANTGAH